MTRIIQWDIGSGNKKYKVILSNGKTVQFGNKNYEQYKDSSPLKIYSNKNHLDVDRKKKYLKRHSSIRLKDGSKAINKKYSPSWLSKKYLWT